MAKAGEWDIKGYFQEASEDLFKLLGEDTSVQQAMPYNSIPGMAVYFDSIKIRAIKSRDMGRDTRLTQRIHTWCCSSLKSSPSSLGLLIESNNSNSIRMGYIGLVDLSIRTIRIRFDSI